jgi:MFS family permease
MLYSASVIPIMLVKEAVFLMPVAFLLGGSGVTGSLVSSYVGSIAPRSKRGLWMSIPLTFSLVASFVAPYLGAYLYTFSPYYAFIASISAVPFLAFYALTRLKD